VLQPGANKLRGQALLGSPHDQRKHSTLHKVKSFLSYKIPA